MNFFPAAEKAEYIARPNRFTLICRLRGRKVNAFLPNPGRLWEVLLPGVAVYLEKCPRDRTLPYTAVAIERDGRPLIVHTHRTNDFVDHLLKKGKVAGLENAKILKREAPWGNARFDFLLEEGGKEIYLEVKSCTLFGKRMAMFPDAVTARGKRHIEELVRLSETGKGGAVLFLVASNRAQYFLPEYHTDLAFSRTFLAAREKISIIPLAFGVRPDLSLAPAVRLLQIPWDLLERECRDRGAYILVLRLRTEKKVEIGRLGRIVFRPGHYLYVGSARKNLTPRLERHRRTRKNLFWHIDYLRESAEFLHGIPIRTSDDIECGLARAVEKIAEWKIPRFGSSDCGCGSHLFGLAEDPLRSPRFISLLQHFRMDRLTSPPE